MRTGRLEAFSDGVLAIIITIMVLELRIPDQPTLDALGHQTGVAFLSYLLSFVYIGIYWNNHHHVFQLVDRVSGLVLWANLALLFSLSLIPFTTHWAEESHWARDPVLTYSVNLMLAGLCYYLLEGAVSRVPGEGERYREAVGFDLKGVISMFAYILAGAAAFVEPVLSLVPIVGVALMWLVPDRRIERFLEQEIDTAQGSSAGPRGEQP
jgi:uncharacterized membrane protein